MNKIIHGLILVFFSVACFFLWALLMTCEIHSRGLLKGQSLPAFTQLCVGLRPALYVLPLLALAWCVFVWLRKTESRNSWVGFFAVSVATVVLVTFPTLMAMYLTIVSALGQMGRQ